PVEQRRARHAQLAASAAAEAHAAAAGHPDAASARRPDRRHLALRQTGAAGEALDAAPGQPGEAAVGADPQRAILPLPERPDGIARQAIGSGEAALAARSERDEALVLGTDPERAVGAAPEALDRGEETAVGVGDRADLAAAQPVEAFPGADQQAAVGLLQQRADLRVVQLGMAAAVDDMEGEAVEAGEPLLGADPQIAVARLQDLLHRALRQTLLETPEIVAVAVDRPAGIEGQQGAGSCARSESCQTRGYGEMPTH